MGEGSDAAVKYHLVEAEEVDPQRAAGNEVKPKKKGELSQPRANGTQNELVD